jgi:hypothetical protein
MQETTAPRSKAFGLISVTSLVFPNFAVKILVSSEMLSTDQDNQIVDNLAFFDKVFAFWITLVRICKNLYAKVVCRIVVVGKFPTFELVFAVFPASG